MMEADGEPSFVEQVAVSLQRYALLLSESWGMGGWYACEWVMCHVRVWEWVSVLGDKPRC